jgi:hypothetical protein
MAPQNKTKQNKTKQNKTKQNNKEFVDVSKDKAASSTHHQLTACLGGSGAYRVRGGTGPTRGCPCLCTPA